MEFQLSTVDGHSIPAGAIVYALFLINKIMSFASDAQRHFGLLHSFFFTSSFFGIVNSERFSNASFYLSGKLII